MNVGKLIKEFRKKKKLTQKELAKIANVAELTIRQYELGKRLPRITQLLKIANALNVSIEQLIGDEIVNDTNIEKMEESVIILMKYYFSMNGIDRKKLIEYAEYICT